MSSADPGSPEWQVVRGDQLPRKQLHDQYGGVRQGGVSPSTVSSNVLLFTDPKANAAHGYVADRWVATDLFEYCGEGQSGHQEVRRYNLSIANHRAQGKALRLFEGWKGVVTYVGEFELDRDEPFYFRFGPDRGGVERRVVIFRLRPVGFEGPGGISSADSVADDALEGTQLAGSPYRSADEQAATTQDRAPFAVDPNEQDRALRAHATAQNVLAQWVLAQGLEPLSPGPGDPAFDLAWRRNGLTYVAEVKSILPINEVRQLRLGLGQVLDYAHQLDAVPVLFVDRRPSSVRWFAIADRAGVLLAWPADCSSLMATARTSGVASAAPLT